MKTNKVLIAVLIAAVVTIFYMYRHLRVFSSWNEEEIGGGGDWRHVPAALLRIAPQIFRIVPNEFLPNYKNPCWYRGSKLHCLPYFYVLGMSKCGTTELWDKITAHPDVAQVPKEPHWWALRRFGWTDTPIHEAEVMRIRKMTGGKDDSSFEWYLNLYKTYGIPKIQSKWKAGADNTVTYPVVFGDSSISNGWDILNTVLKGGNTSTVMEYLTAELIHAIQPNAKLIFAVRNPTNREYSDYYYCGGTDAEAFEEEEQPCIAKLTACLKEKSELYCLYFERKCGLHRGTYVVYLKEWIRLFGKDGVYVFRLEDWKADPSGEYQKILKFLELPELSPEKVRNIVSRSPANVAERNSPPMLNSTRVALDDFYRPFNQRLAKLLGDAKYEFKRQ